MGRRSCPPGNLWRRCFLVGHVAGSGEQRENALRTTQKPSRARYTIEIRGRGLLRPLFFDRGGIVCCDEVILERVVISARPLFGFLTAFVETARFEIRPFLVIRCREMIKSAGPVTRIYSKPSKSLF